MQHTLPIKYDDIYKHILVDGTNLNLRKLQKLRRSIYIYIDIAAVLNEILSYFPGW